jgi:hypothetical protein
MFGFALCEVVRLIDFFTVVFTCLFVSLREGKYNVMFGLLVEYVTHVPFKSP